jgi:acyl-CoA synthetase (AMP-forming)/AMP-acid ligase II
VPASPSTPTAETPEERRARVLAKMAGTSSDDVAPTPTKVPASPSTPTAETPEERRARVLAKMAGTSEDVTKPAAPSAPSAPLVMPSLRPRREQHSNFDDYLSLYSEETSFLIPWSRRELMRELDSFDLGPWGVRPGDRIAMLVPNGQRAALSLFAGLRRYCVVTIDPMQPAANVSAALGRLYPRCLVTLAGPKGRQVSEASNIPLVCIKAKGGGGDQGDHGAFILVDPPAAPKGGGGGGSGGSGDRIPLTKLSETVLILQTSGTTSLPKLVTFSVERLLESGKALRDSMHLSASDVGLNTMPMHHVGGIACNMMAPLVSTGRMVYSTWTMAEEWYRTIESKSLPITWCYAAPVMWANVAKFGEEKRSGVRAVAHRMRLLRSGAASLPHAEAARLAKTFGGRTCVMPTYSMTECMPVATPPLGYKLERPGTVGRAALCLDLRIVDKETKRPLGANQIGLNTLRSGPHLFKGYGVPAVPRDPNFATGDLGQLDADGWLYLTGRSKEVVNRGGELISPFLVEEALAHPKVSQLMAFAAPHEELGEVVGIALPRGCNVTFEELKMHGMKTLSLVTLPQVLVTCPELPKTRGTGKLQRVGFAEKVGLPTISDNGSHEFRVEDNGSIRKVTAPAGRRGGW